MNDQDGKRRILFILNPKAGHGFHDTLHRLIAAAFPADRFDTTTAVTGLAGHARQLSLAAAKDRYDAVVAVGGDGTVNEVAEPLSGTATALGIVPSGSGNGFARHLGIPVPPEAALAVVAGGRTRRIDSLRINDRFCLNLAGAGFDALVADRFAHSPRRGFGTYFRLVVRHYFRYNENTFTVRCGEREIRRQALLVCVANGAQFGNGARIAPQADPGDGLLDVVVLHKLSPLRVLPAVTALFAGTLPRQSFIETFRAATAEVTCDTPVYYHLDGEPAGTTTRLQAHVVPRSHNVLVP